MNIMEITKRFNTQKKCIRHLEFLRWGKIPVCPYCASPQTTRVTRENRHHCNSCNNRFSVLVGTIFQDTNLKLSKWFVAITLVLNAKKGISSRQLARDICVNKKTAWLLQMRIRKAMRADGKLLKGIVEIDETYVGGDIINKTKRHRIDRHATGKRITGIGDKTPVMGFIQRSGPVVTQVLDKANLETMRPVINKLVDKDSTVITDGFGPYRWMVKEYRQHEVVNHEKDEFVRGHYHTNSIEGFWSLIKRSIIGQYHQISKRYMQSYFDECAFKFNNRKNPLVFNEFMGRALGLTPV